MAKQSAGKKAQYTKYQATDSAKKNKQRRLARHQKNHPNDAQAANAVASGHTRKTPGPNGPKVPDTGFVITGERTIKGKNGKDFQVPVFEFVQTDNLDTAPRVTGSMLALELRVQFTAQEIKAGLGL